MDARAAHSLCLMVTFHNRSKAVLASSHARFRAFMNFRMFAT